LFRRLAKNRKGQERILKVPRWLMGILFPWKYAQGFSVPNRSRKLFVLILIMTEASEAVLYVLGRNLSVLWIMLGSLAFFVSLLVVTFFFPIFIRKDCFNCEFRFHIVAHEQAHLSLDSYDEEQVETETLKETRNRLIPLLLSNQRICKNCRFRWYKMLSQSTSEYLEEQKSKMPSHDK
jgi:hypothetical protein